MPATEQSPFVTTAASPVASPHLRRRLLEAASFAPSPDNNQPWAFRFRDENELAVFHCRERAVPSDVGDLFSGLALGAAIENVALEASTRNLTTEVEYAPDPFARTRGPEPVATLRLAPWTQADPLAAYIAGRITNRRPYRREDLPHSHLAAMSAALQTDECTLGWVSGRTQLKQMASLVYAADRVRFEYEPFHNELHRVLRLTPAEALATRDGLEFRSLEIPGIARLLFGWLKPWSRMRRMNRFGLSRAFARNSITLVRRSAAIGVLMTQRNDAVGFLEAGRALQRVWLTAAALGLAFQPLAALPLFLRRLAVLGPASFLPHHARLLEQSQQQFRELVPLARTSTPVMLFRIGHCAPPSSRNLRYHVEQIDLDHSAHEYVAE